MASATEVVKGKRASDRIAFVDIAFVDAVIELRDWTHGEGICYPDVSASNSCVDQDGNWLLFSDDNKLIARVGYTETGVLAVL